MDAPLVRDHLIVRIAGATPYQWLATAMLKLAVDDGDADWLGSDDALVYFGLITPPGEPLEALQRAAVILALRGRA